MSIKFRLTVMNFMQFFVWGAWLISLGAYMIVTLGFSGGQVGSIYATMGVASLFMPGLMGIVADRWLNAERLYGVLHLVSAGLLLWASTVLGIGVHFRFRPANGPLTLILESHRICSSLALSFVAGHVTALLVDPVVHFSLLDAFVPFTSSYRAIQVGLGTIAMWLLIATLASTAAAAHMRYTTWRTLHYLAFPCYLLALIHGITAGTDATSVVALTLYATTAAIVAALTFARILGRGFVAAGEAPSPIG